MGTACYVFISLKSKSVTVSYSRWCTEGQSQTFISAVIKVWRSKSSLTCNSVKWKFHVTTPRPVQDVTMSLEQGYTLTTSLGYVLTSSTYEKVTKQAMNV